MVDTFFDIFNSDTEVFGNTVDPDELASGLSVLCGDDREEKVEAAFDMFDFDNNGFIDLFLKTTTRDRSINDIGRPAGS